MKTIEQQLGTVATKIVDNSNQINYLQIQIEHLNQENQQLNNEFMRLKQKQAEEKQTLEAAKQNENGQAAKILEKPTANGQEK